VDISLFLELAYDDPHRRDLRSVYHDALEQVELADRLGYRNVWITEHHFLPSFSASSSPEIFLSAAAARTQNIRLGHGIVLLPHRINHPLRVAERAATLDQISNGRLDWGGGRALTDIELEPFGIAPDDTREQWEESLAAIPQMWMNEQFAWDSPMLKIPKRTIVPRPVQDPHPPMYVAVTQPYSLEFAARNGLGVLGFGVQQGDAGAFVDTYRSMIVDAKPIGGFVTNRFNSFVIGLCLDDHEEALRIQAPNFYRYWDYVQDLYRPWKEGAAPRTYAWALDKVIEAQEYLRTAKIEDLTATGGAAIGNVDECVQSLQSYADAGVDEVMILMGSFTTPQEKILRSIELFATEVMPRVKSGSSTAT
jgi:alkanesulfonate monooxygenase SsuD/methylene tetrahydromethanopterin reductase-like flavin-dependent oxidoreductase (luciferase family)